MSTSAPPASWIGARRSARTPAASTTVTTGSKVERIDALVGPTALSPAKKSVIAPTVETMAMQASQPHPASVTAPGCSCPVSGRSDGERERGASADECREHERRHTARDAVADEDVCAVRERRPKPQRDTDAVDVRGPRCAKDEHQPRRDETECERAASVEALAPERHRGNGDDRRERVQDERQQRCVEMLERGEIAPGLERVPTRAEAQSDHQITSRDRAHL